MSSETEPTVSSGEADFRAKADRLRENARRTGCPHCREAYLKAAKAADERAEGFQ